MKKEKQKLNAVVLGKDASLKKGGIPKNYSPQQKCSKIGIKPLTPSECFMDKGFPDHISGAQVSQVSKSSEDEEMKDYYDSSVQEIQESRCFGEEEEIEYAYGSLKEEIQCMAESKPEGDMEYSYENTIKEIQDMPPLGFEEVEYTYDSLVNELQNTQCFAVEARGLIMERIAR